MIKYEPLYDNDNEEVSDDEYEVAHAASHVIYLSQPVPAALLTLLLVAF